MENPIYTFLTPTTISGDRQNVDVIAHELCHSWSGNLVSLSSWEVRTIIPIKQETEMGTDTGISIHGSTRAGRRTSSDVSRLHCTASLPETSLPSLAGKHYKTASLN